jgi:hypothetical protein
MPWRILTERGEIGESDRIELETDGQIIVYLEGEKVAVPMTGSLVVAAWRTDSELRLEAMARRYRSADV